MRQKARASKSIKPLAITCASVLFSELCEVFDRIDATTKRLEINEILKILFIRLIKDNPEDLATVVHLSLSRVPLFPSTSPVSSCSWGRRMLA